MLAYGEQGELFPHLALTHGEREQGSGSVVDVRIHSECMTGDVFGSTRCECGEQLDAAMDYLSKHDGVLIYLRQEGRGIGLVEKMKAYNFQDEGLDTVEANLALGHAPDLRNYWAAAEILKDLGISRIRLLTNNPKKITGLESLGISVESRMGLEVDSRPENEGYLAVKKAIMGHLLS
jgi:3,4-dihydroxy 2-butanone 4-phosphate synthase/GTP cyclohydrolase II